MNDDLHNNFSYLFQLLTKRVRGRIETVSMYVPRNKHWLKLDKTHYPSGGGSLFPEEI